MSAKASQQAVYMQDRGFRWLRWQVVRRVFLYLVSAGGLAMLVVYLQQPDTLPINKIHAIGAFNMVNESMLREVVSQTVTGGYFTVNVSEVRQAVENLPWVYQAEVSRVWPDTISINVTEQKALALWAMGGIVSRQGKVFEPIQIEGIGALPVFDGPAGMERNMTEFYQSAKQVIEPLGLKITRLKVDTRRAYRLTLDNGIVVLLGRDNTQDRLMRFIRVYQKVLAVHAPRIARVDTRYSNGLAVGWREQQQE